jgi:TonB family protein
MTPHRALPLLAALLLACGAEPPLEEPIPLTHDSPFRYPIELWDAGIEGETLLRVRVTRTGGVDSAYVDVSSGHAQFDSAAVAGARDLRFAPARQGDKRIDAWVRFPVRFVQDPAIHVHTLADTADRYPWETLVIQGDTARVRLTALTPNTPSTAGLA